MKHLILAIVLYCFSLSAQSAVLVTSSLLEQVDMSAGQSARRIIKIHNNGKTAAEVKIYLEDKNVSGAIQKHARSNKSWVSLGLSKVRLAAGESKNIPYNIQAPNSNGYVGTYWSNIMVEPIKAESRESINTSSNKDKFTVAIRSTTRYAIAVMSHLGAADAKYSISSPRVESDQSGAKVLRFNVKNIGKRHGRFSPSLDVFESNGRKVAILKGNLGGVYPQVLKRISIPLTKLKNGNYKTLLSLEDKNSGQSFGVDINLSILP